MGVETAIAVAAIGAGMFGTAMAVDANQQAQDQQNSLAKAEAEKARQQQKDMLERQHQLQLEQMQESAKIQEQQYKMYQSPAATASQLRAIGVNPASYFGSGKGMNTSMPSAITPSALSAPGSPMAVIPQSLNQGAVINDGFRNGAQALSNISDYMKTDKERKRLQAETDKLLAEKYGQDLLNNHQAIVNEVAKWSIPEQAKAQLNKTLYEASALAADGRYKDAMTAYQGILSKIGSKELEIKTEEAANAPFLFARQVELLGEKVNTEKTQQTANKASAYEATTAAQLNLSKKEFQGYENRIKAIEAENTEAAKVDMLNSMLSDLHAQAAQSKQKKLAAEIQRFRDQFNDPRNKSGMRQRVDAAFDWLRQKFGLGMSLSVHN